MKPIKHLLILLLAMSLLLVLPAGASAATWSLLTTTNPSSHSALLDISCTKGPECTAVGYSGVSNSTLAERWNGTSWSTQTTPVIEESELLRGVSCSSSTSCLAVGFSATGSPRAEQWNGTKWSALTFAKPTGSTSIFPTDISCISATSCIAAGSYIKAGAVFPLSEIWGGKEWAVQSPPTPTGATSTQFARVSCTTTLACTAVGHYTNSEAAIVPLAERWNGKEWTIQTTPIPVGETDTELLGVSCTSAEACTAVGGAQHGVNTQKTLVESWNGKEWTIQSSPNPKEANASVLQDVSCVSAEACATVGDFVDASPKNVTLAESWNGKEWSIQTTPDPAGSTFAALWGVSCLTSTSCLSAGFYEAAGSLQTFAEKYS